MSIFQRKHAGLTMVFVFLLGHASPILAMESPVGEAAPREEAAVEIPGEIIVKFKLEAVDLGNTPGRVAAARLGRDSGLITSDVSADQNLALFIARDVSKTESILADLKSNPMVANAEPNFRRTVKAFPSNDPLGSALWALENTGQEVDGVSGTEDADIDGTEAWAINEGTHAPVIVAVIDTGVDLNHEDLQNNLWDGSSCVDDNGESLGGCLHGYDFYDDDNDPTPPSRIGASFHGTHVAGTIAAEKGNAKGIAGVAPHAKIMALRTGDFFLSSFAIIRSIDFARHNGAKVINASYGGGGYSQAEFDAMKAFTDNGGVFVAAAGNESSDNDASPSYPASYGIDNVITVAATDQNDGLAGFSNFGAQSVDVGAPGVNIKSTSFQNEIGQVFTTENFDGAAIQGVPSGWSRSGTMGVVSSPAFGGSHALGSDAFTTPYTINGAGSAIMPAINLLPGSGAKALAFDAWCDTEYDLFAYTDYVKVDVSANGGPFLTLGFLDEYDLDDDDDSGNAPPVRSRMLPFFPEDISAATTVRFRWFTDGDANTGTTGGGCHIENLQVVTIGLQDTYEFLDGTSMAAPHVSGLAALLRGYNPALTNTDVNNIILSTGDERASLQGRTVTGRRINAANAMRRADLVKPVITLNGATPVTVAQNAAYVDAAASANDDIDGDITARIVTVNPVNTAVLGDYVVTYDVTDFAGNAADQVTRTVTVTAEETDTTPPVIALIGENPLMILQDSVFNDPGATADDNVDGNITANIVVTGSVDAHVLGDYVLHYNVSDAAGNPAVEVTRTVTVSAVPAEPDTTPPVITLIGANPFTVLQGQTFTDPGATASDNIDGDITANIIVAGSVNTNVPGDYILTYNVNDTAENSATEVTRTVTVIQGPDTTPPVITLLGSAEMNLIAGNAFVDPGSTAVDDRDGTITAQIVVTGTVNINIPGEYILRYNVSDEAGNAATEVTRKVIVIAQQVDPGPSPTPSPSVSTDSGGRGSEGQGNGSSRGQNTSGILRSLDMLLSLHTPEKEFNPADFTDNQEQFLCSVQRMIKAEMTQGLLERIAMEIETLTGIPGDAALGFLADAHACDTVNVARQGITIAAKQKQTVFAIAADGFPVSSNPTWNACVRGIYDLAIIRSNPDRDPRTGRAYSCDHYSNATNSWTHPDLHVMFTLVNNGSGRTPVVALPRGYLAVSTSLVAQQTETTKNEANESPAPVAAATAAATASEPVNKPSGNDTELEEERLMRIRRQSGAGRDTSVNIQ